MKQRSLLFLFFCIVLNSGVFAQSGTEFWFAPPDVTASHNAPGGVPIYLNISTFNGAATVVIDQPANPGFAAITVPMAANSSSQVNLTAFVASLETAPTNTILTTGLRVVATDTITAYYEVSNTNNADIFSLKGAASLGQEFYIPLHKHEAFWNHDTYSSPNLAYASFDIVATEDNTTVTIYSPVDVDGIPALTPFSVMLDAGETYSCGNTDQTLEFFPYRGSNEPAYTIPANHPSGAVVLSDKDIAITIKDDSNHNPSGGCYDLLGDQIVPIGIVGTEYIAVKGQLNATGDESAFILATENNTQVYFDGAVTPTVTLFAGQTYRYDMDYLDASVDNSVYIVTSKPAYVTHVTGFGCEEGQAVLPPLGCAGSEQISIIRSTAEAFFLNIMVRTGSEDDFTVTGAGTAAIVAGDFQDVPGTAGVWKAAQIQFNGTEIPVNSAHLVSNSTNVFTLAIVNGGASSGCRYGFFSEYAAEILLDPGVDLTVCANDTAQLASSISGGTSTGVWTTSGSGQFLPDATTLNAMYVPSPADISAGSVTLFLTSTGNCTPVQDQITLNVTPAPTVDAGVDQTVCENNATVNLAASVTIASGGIWSGGAGVFSPNNTSLVTSYTPSAAEIAANTLNLTVTSTGNGTCNPVSDVIQISFTDAPVVNASSDQSACENNPDITLGGGIIGATGALWTGGAGTFAPNANALTASYTPTVGEITAGSVNLTLTSLGNGGCNAVSDVVTLTYTGAPTSTAGGDQTLCGNNEIGSLLGSVSGATGGIWSGGLGNFAPNNTTLNAAYTPTAAEITSGSVTLTLSTSGNGNCLAVTDDVAINYTAIPTSDAGTDISVCENNANVSLGGSITVSTGGNWTGGAGTFSPNSNTLNATYTPTAAEITSGALTLTLSTTGNGNCNVVTDVVDITFTPAPVVNAGTNQSACGNNPDLTLAGSITIASGGLWTGGAGTFSPNANALNAIYTPSAAEVLAGSTTLTLTSSGNGTCNAESDNVTLTYTASPTINSGIDQTLCSNNEVATLAGNVTGATGATWTGGLGVFTPNANTLNATYGPTAAELVAGSVNLTLTTTGNGGCIAVTDDMTINYTVAPTSDAGTDVSVCANNANVTLGGAVTIATGGAWSGGAGTYSPNANNLSPVYTPTAAEITSGSLTLTLSTTGNGTCNVETNDVEITFTDAPVVNAGPNQTTCANNADVLLAGTVTIASGGTWTGGAGTFNPSATAFGATYSPSAGEIIAGSVTLTLSSTGNGNCNAVSDNVTLTFTAAPTVNASVDQTLCANNSDVTLAGSVTGATGGSWTGGLGVFTPNNTTLNAVYTPTVSEIASGNMTFTLTTTGNGSCVAETDDMSVTFTAAPTSDAGVDIDVCENNPNVSLGGAVTIATGGVWLGGAGTFSPANNNLNATYTPTAAEVAAGSLTLSLETTNNGSCIAVTDMVDITFTPAPIVNAGTDETACANNADVTLAGLVSGAAGGIWSGGSGTFSPSSNALNATYTPTAGEVSAGSIVLTLTSTGNADCNAVTDNMTITYTVAPTSNAGADQILCANNSDVTLSGAITGATGVSWSGGLGAFTPNNTSTNTTYTPTVSEVASGGITLTLTTTGNGSCLAATDDIAITYTAAPTSAAGADVSVCSNNSNVNLAGMVTIASGGVWLGGSGAFAPGNNNLSAVYTPSATEIANGSVALTLETTGNGNCIAVTDAMLITINQEPTANAGPNLTSCGNNPNVNLGGSITNATGGLWTGGNGTFIASSTDLNAVYTPSPAEITAGIVNLTLSTTGNGNCISASDNVLINITIAPTASAGPDQTLCGNNEDAQLNGSVSIAAGGQWSGGLGTFAPSSTALNAVYSPTGAEIAGGMVELILTTTGNGDCNAVKDTILINYTPAPSADAGLDITTCVNSPNANLSGSIAVASGAVWSGGAGVFTPSNTDLNAVYTPSSTEITTGTVSLTLTTTGIGNCNIEDDVVTIVIDPLPIVDAGPDESVCVSNLTVNLSGSVSGGTNTGEWTSSGTGTFVPNNTSLNASYVASAADSLAGSITLTLTSTNNGNCLPVTDEMVVSILPAGFSDAGADQTVCANNSNVSLSGVITGGAVDGVWSSSGTGVFTPNDSTLNASYIPSAFDAANGTVTLTLTASSCNAGTDNMVITITPAPIVNAGPDITVCADNLTIPLISSVTGGSTTGIWATLGTGTFSPGNTDLNASYIASSADSLNQSTTLYLTATNIGNCVSVVDSITINIFPTGVVDAGSDQTLCANNGDAILNGSITGGATAGIWTTSGTGGFIPNNTDLNATYSPSAGDISIGSVNLVLTSTNSCNVATDFVVITYPPAPVVDAGSDLSICGTNASIAIVASVTGAAGGIWTTSGSGTFAPSNTNLTPTYTASAADIAGGGATVYLTSTGNGNCNAVVDSAVLSITNGILVNAGPDQQICSSAAFGLINGIVSNGSTTGIWTTLGTGTFAPADTVLTIEYNFSAADVTNGSVLLILTSSNNGSCAAETDTMEITFGNSVYTNAGADQTVCETFTDVNLSGIVSGGSITGMWQSTGSGTFNPDNVSLNTVYEPSATDIANGTVDIIILSTNNGGCLQGSDTMTVLIEQLPVVSVGADKNICSNVDSIQISALLTNATGGVWTTDGSGTFSPSDTLANAYYIPSAFDINNGQFELSFASNSATVCTEDSDTLIVSVINAFDIGFRNNSTCVNMPMNFTDTSVVIAGTLTDWLWEFGDGDSSLSQNPVHVYDVSGTYDVKLTINSSLGCQDSKIQTVIISDGPSADFSFSPTSILVNDIIGFTDLSSADASIYSWNFGDGTPLDSTQNPNHSYGSVGSYEVIQVVRSNFGCIDTAKRVVQVNFVESNVFAPVVPSGFSPNEDNENDVLLVRGGPFTSVSLKVYNNWGNLIFESIDPAVGWDGTWKNKLMPVGDYVYAVTAVTIDGKVYEFTGSVSIIK